MEVRNLLTGVVFATVIVSSAAICEIKNLDLKHCNYTVVCTTNPGSVSNPNCDVDAYLIFVIMMSKLEYLTTGYFAATNFDSRVREIKAVGNSWNTITSSAFRYYTKTAALDISANEIVNIKNEAFINLKYLLYLNISNNRIETLNSKSFLISTDGRDNYVQDLDLSNNRLIELSNELNELSHLKRLYLQNNVLTNIADDAFMSLKNLNELYLQNNRLQFLNLTLTNLKMLKILDVSNNYLMKLSGYEVNRLVAIEVFNASHNALTSVESNCFNQAFSLKKVDFSYNHIKTNIENVMFINNNKLTYLNYNNNRITNIQENAFQHCSLDYINFENNNITGDINENTLAGLQNISKLDLSQQSISGIKNKAFQGMENLVYLNLSTNNIGIIENSTFVNTTISLLDLSYNKVSNLNFLQNCLTNLSIFNISNNNIVVVPANAFASQTKMENLDLSMNKIKFIAQNSLPLKNLQYLNITGNNISGVIRKNVFSPAKYLRFLDLSNLNITKIDDSAFVDLTVLVRLNISNNQISTINPNNFKGVDNMYSLDMSRNILTDLIFNNSILTNLKSLYLNNNDLKNISKIFSTRCKLLYLDMSNNNIDDLSEVGANLLPNITVLHLASNNISQFNNPSINSLTTLIDLGLSSNEISEINLSYFKELMSIDISNNKLTYINSTILRNNQYLQFLDISRNNISDLPPGTFQFMKNLKLLNFSSNYLTNLRYGCLKGLHKTEVLDFSRNNIAMLDADVFHECNELKTLIIDYNRIKSFDVERLVLISLRQLKTLSLGGNPISCKEIVRNIKASNVTYFTVRQVEVTSIDKIYHEDNVHGIKCGDDAIISETTTVKADSHKTEPVNDSSFASTAIVLTWCSILTIILIAGGIIGYVKLFKKRILVVNSNMSLQMRNSLDMEGSEFQNDLLS